MREKPNFNDAERHDKIKNPTVTGMLNTERFQEWMSVLNSVRNELKDQDDVKVTYELYQPFKTMASITIEGSQIKFENPALFLRMAKMADNFEFYPLIDDKARLTFTFYGIVK